jgi:hypothetical protein
MWPRLARRKTADEAAPALPGSPIQDGPPADPTKPEPPLAGAAKAAVPPRIRTVKRARVTEDILLGLFGVALGLGSAYFPWYVFFNQEKFGIRAVELDSDIQSVDGLSSSTPQIARIADPADVKEITSIDLDLLPTGTTPPEEKDKQSTGSVPSIVEQPFPHREASFRVVHIENGRAMIEDESGLWIVQRGSTLPDMSTVAAIEQRADGWVVVTSDKRVLGLSR